VNLKFTHRNGATQKLRVAWRVDRAAILPRGQHQWRLSSWSLDDIDRFGTSCGCGIPQR